MFEEQIEEFGELPEEIQLAVSDDAAMAKVQAIEQKFSLQLSLYIVRLAVGDIFLKSLPRVLEDELEIESSKALAVTQELKDKVLIKIKNHLDKLQAERGASPVPEDDEEVRKAKDEITSLEKPRSLEEVAEEVVNESGINLTDEVLIKRFKKIILLRLKDIRDNLETSAVLMRPTKVGGLGLVEDNAYDILDIVRKRSAEIAAIDMQRVRLADKKAKEEEVRKTEKPEEEKTREIKPEKFYTKGLDVSHELAPPPPVVVKKKHLELREEQTIAPSTEHSRAVRVMRKI